MRITLLSVAALFTAGLIPGTYKIAANRGRDGHPAALGILVLCGLRAVVLIAALLLNGWSALTTIAAVLIFEFAAFRLHLYSIDNHIRAPFPAIYGILATALPVCVIAAAFLSAHTAFLSASAVALVAALFGHFANHSLAADWVLATRDRGVEEGGGADRRKSELARLPTDASVEELLPFLAPSEPWVVRRDAQARLESMLADPESVSSLRTLVDRFPKLPESVQHAVRAATAHGLATIKDTGDLRQYREIDTILAAYSEASGHPPSQ
jgi:hypothetical protein